MGDGRDGVYAFAVGVEDGVAVDDAGAVGGDVFGRRDVFGEDVADEGGVDGEGDDGAEGGLFRDDGGGIGDTEHWVGTFPVAAGDTGAEGVCGVGFWSLVAVMMVMVVVVVAVGAGGGVFGARVRAGCAGCPPPTRENAGLPLEGRDAARVEGAGVGGA